MLNVFIGYDQRERLAWHVLADSILSQTHERVSLIPIGTRFHGGLSGARREDESTEFSRARFLVPYLCGYTGVAIFMDCDMVMNSDIGALADQCKSDDQPWAIKVVKHEYQPASARKFLDERQVAYSRKNWSSLILWNCAHPALRVLSPSFVATAAGLDLHRFYWLDSSLIGDITGRWNVLSTAEGLQHPERLAGADSLTHYTEGGPWHGVALPASGEWMKAAASMLGGGNPAAVSVMSGLQDGHAELRVVFQRKAGDSDGQGEKGQGRQGQETLLTGTGPAATPC